MTFTPLANYMRFRNIVKIYSLQWCKKKVWNEDKNLETLDGWCRVQTMSQIELKVCVSCWLTLYVLFRLKGNLTAKMLRKQNQKQKTNKQTHNRKPRKTTCTTRNTIMYSLSFVKASKLNEFNRFAFSVQLWGTTYGAFLSRYTLKLVFIT